MFFRTLLTSSMISILLLSHPLKAMEDGVEAKQSLRYKELTRDKRRALLQKTTQARSLEPESLCLQLTLNLHSLYKNEFGGNLAELEKFLISSTFANFLWRKHLFRIAYSSIGVVQSRAYHGKGNLFSDDEEPELPLFSLLFQLFGEERETVQEMLISAVDRVIEKRMIEYKNLDSSLKRAVLRRATKMKGNTIEASELAKNLYTLYQEEFNKSFIKLCSFIKSPEFIAFLSVHPHRREAFNRIAIERSAQFVGRDDLDICTIEEHPLYSLLFKLFGNDLGQLQGALSESIKSVSFPRKINSD